MFYDIFHISRKPESICREIINLTSKLYHSRGNPPLPEKKGGFSKKRYANNSDSKPQSQYFNLTLSSLIDILFPNNKGEQWA